MDWRARKKKRQNRALLAILVLTIGVGIAGGAWAQLFGQTRPAHSPSCEVPASLPPGGASVNVLNATKTTGLADRAAAALGTWGFSVKSVGNAPSTARFVGAAEIAYGPTGEKTATQLAAVIPGSALKPDKRSDASVDVLLGPRFSGVANPATLASCPTSRG